MRGDSLRDLYAKTLALVGLGMLAGTGALVDYWPSGISLPGLTSEMSLPAPALALATPATPVEIQVARRTRPAASAAANQANQSMGRTFALNPVRATSSPLRLRLTPRTPAPALRADLVSSSPRIDAQDVRLVRPEGPVAVQLLAEQTHQAPVSGDGLLYGAFKKTGASILRTGKKTGGTIVDAVRGIGGAVRRVIPTL